MALENQQPELSNNSSLVEASALKLPLNIFTKGNLSPTAGMSKSNLEKNALRGSAELPALTIDSNFVVAAVFDEVRAEKTATAASDGLPKVELVSPLSVEQIAEEGAFRSAVKVIVQQAKEGKQITFQIDNTLNMSGPDGKLIDKTQAIILYDELRSVYPEKDFNFSKPDLKPGDAGYTELPAPKVETNGLQISSSENKITLVKELTLADGRRVPVGSQLANGTTYNGKEFKSADPQSRVWAVTPEGEYIEVAKAGEGAVAAPDTISQEFGKRGQIVDTHYKEKNGKLYENHIIVRTAKGFAPDGRPLLDVYPSAGEDFEKAYKKGSKSGYYAPKAKSANHFLLPENITVNAKTAWGDSIASGKDGTYFMDTGFGDTKEATAKNYTGETDPRSARELMRIRAELGMTGPTQVEAGLAKAANAARKEVKAELEGAGRPLERSAPERGPAPSAEGLQRAAVSAVSDGTIQRTDTHVGERVSIRQLAEQTEVSSEQIRGLEKEVERLKNSENPAEKQRAKELELAVKTLKGEFGATARANAHKAIMETTRTEIANRRIGGKASFGVFMGIGILTSAALTWYLSKQKQQTTPLSRSRFGGKEP